MIVPTNSSSSILAVLSTSSVVRLLRSSSWLYLRCLSVFVDCFVIFQPLHQLSGCRIRACYCSCMLWLPLNRLVSFHYPQGPPGTTQRTTTSLCRIYIYRIIGLWLSGRAEAARANIVFPITRIAAARGGCTWQTQGVRRTTHPLFFITRMGSGRACCQMGLQSQHYFFHLPE